MLWHHGFFLASCVTWHQTNGTSFADRYEITTAAAMYYNMHAVKRWNCARCFLHRRRITLMKSSVFSTIDWFFAMPPSNNYNSCFAISSIVGKGVSPKSCDRRALPIRSFQRQQTFIPMRDIQQREAPRPGVFALWEFWHPNTKQTSWWVDLHTSINATKQRRNKEQPMIVV